MSVLFLLIAISILLSALFVAVCILSIRSGQFDDLESPRWRVLFADSQGTLPLKSHLKTESLARMDHDDSH